jgi:hypothetical protein
MRVDAILITTIDAPDLATAEKYMQDFADGLANDNGAPFTGLVDTGDTDNEGQRVFYLHPIDKPSPCGGAEDGWHLNASE